MRRALAQVAIVVGVITGSATAATAHQLPLDWQQGHQIGDICGLTSGHYVKWLQAMLWADNNLSGTGDGAVDGYFGAVTRWGVGSYQLDHGTGAADGCAGFNTIGHMQRAHRYYVGPNGFYERYQYRGEKTVNLDYDPIWNCWVVRWLPTSFNIVHGWGTAQPCTS